MSLLPKHRVSRRIAIAWLIGSCVTLLVTLARVALHEGDRSALAVLVPLYWLSLPLGHAGMLMVIEARTALYVSGTATGLLVEGLASWLMLAALGYAQWFLLLPLLARMCQQMLQFLFNREAARNGRTR